MFVFCFRCIIKGNKNFLGEIKIKNADADFVNNVHTYNTLVRSRTMEVAGKLSLWIQLKV